MQPFDKPQNIQMWRKQGCGFAEPEPEPPEPTHFGGSRSRRNGLLGARAGAGAVKNGAAPAAKRETIVENNGMLTAK